MLPPGYPGGGTLNGNVLLEPDPLALAVVLEPEIIQRYETHYIEIELADTLSRGQTVIDWDNLTGYLYNVKVVMEIDNERFWELMRSSLA
jgi:purine nucleosidase